MTDNESEPKNGCSNNEEQNSQKQISGNLPEEVVEVLEELPPDAKKIVGTFLSMQRVSTPYISPLLKQINPGHIDKILDGAEKDSQRAYQEFTSAETTKRIAMGAILFIVFIVLIYSGITKETAFSEKIINAVITALGGFGAGALVFQKK